LTSSLKGDIFKKFKMKKILIVIIIILVASPVAYKIFHHSGESFVVDKVRKGDISQIVSVTGEVKRGDKIGLGFESSGRIEKIYVGVGDKVKNGQPLAKLDTNELSHQLDQAKAELERARASYDKLMAGSTKAEISLSQERVDKAKVGVDTAKNNLIMGYKSSLDTLKDSYLKSKEIADAISTLYVYDIRIKDFIEGYKDDIQNFSDDIKDFYDKTNENSSEDNIDECIKKTEEDFEGIDDRLLKIRELAGQVQYQALSSTQKDLINTQREVVNLTLTNLSTLQSNLSSLKLTLKSAEESLQIAEKELEVLKSPPREEDIRIYQSQVQSASAQVELLEDKISKSILKSPVDGRVIEVSKKEGETISSFGSSPFIYLLPPEPFQIEIDIPETDIVKVKLGDPCKINLDALPEINFSGKVIEIDPAETVIGGVVYYKTEISFNGDEQEMKKVKPGMTANVDIISASKKDVLIIPRMAVIEKDGKKIVRLLQGKDKFEEVEVQLGLRGNQDKVEVISGLKEGDSVITFIKK